MKLKKGQLLTVISKDRTPREAFCFAEWDFDTDKVEFYPIRNATSYVNTNTASWYYGESLLSRKGRDELFEVDIDTIKKILTSIEYNLQADPRHKTLLRMKHDFEYAYGVQFGINFMRRTSTLAC